MVRIKSAPSSSVGKITTQNLNSSPLIYCNHDVSKGERPSKAKISRGMEYESDAVEKDEKESSVRVNPRTNATVFSILTFYWVLPTFLRGLKKEFYETELTEPLPEHSSVGLSTKIEKEWKKEVELAKRDKRDPSFFRVVLRMFGLKFMFYASPIFFTEVLRTIQPLLIGNFLGYFDPNSTMPYQEAAGYAAGIACCSLIGVLIMHPYMQGMSHLGMKLRVAASCLIYKKALCIGKLSRGKTSSGQVINLLSNDVGKFDYCFLFLHVLWIGPLQTCIVTVLIWQDVGLAAIFGIITILAAIPLQGYISKCASRYRFRTGYRTDERIRVMNEIITGIQVIKMYTWEAPFAKLAALARLNEVKEILKLSWVKGILMSFILFHTRIAIFVTVLAYVLMGNVVQAQKIFVVVGLINTLRQTMSVAFPQSLFIFVEALVSIQRIGKFLKATENVEEQPRGVTQGSSVSSSTTQKLKMVTSNDTFVSQPAGRYVRLGNSVQNPGVRMEDAWAKWDSMTPDIALQNVTMRVIPQQLTIVIGPVGSGKTTLLHALINELFLTSGVVYVSGSISYASQEPWLFNGTVRENILFGSNYNRQRYRKVIKVCMLTRDFELLPYGDKTLVSERGTPLSGGQRARVNLARAVYKESDIYLLDDPLSAVDTQVGKRLFEDCIRDFLNSKTVILVTHQVQYLKDVSQIILMNNGSIIATGSYEELIKSGQDFLQDLASEQQQVTANDGKIQDGRFEDYKKSLSHPSSRSSSYDSKDREFDVTGVAEAQVRGSVGARVYAGYFKAMGNCFMVGLMFFMFILAQALASGADYWLSYWINVEEFYFKENRDFPLTRPDFVWIFCGLSVGVLVVTLLRSFLFFRTAMTASINLHNEMFNCIVRTAMLFFTKNSAGRILNRFSRDIGIVDEILPQTLIDVLQIGLNLIAIVTIVAVVNHWILIATAVCFVIFFFIRYLYQSTARGIKRVEGICRSPVFGHVNSTLVGLPTIRAFNAEQQMTRKFFTVLDQHSSAWFLFISGSRAFGYALDLICSVYITLVAFSFIVLDIGATSGDVGLALTQSVIITGMFQWGMRQSAELENCMTSVERILEYTKLESEANMESPLDKKPDKSWPREGKIEFRDVYLRYSRTEQWVLKALTLTVEPGEKVGIVGRTGAGKSSLISSLFRLSEISGKIIIDGVDVTEIGLKDLRSKISIIPQEPMLFYGTIRSNLDLFEEYTDEMLWNVLEQVELKDAVKATPQGLQTVVSEGGVNMSVGQRQLVCLARALLRKNRILVLDEATANVDPLTDALIQRTIRTKFQDCTVLTVAHRLNTVMDSDKVVVMSAGIAVEIDTPYNLLRNKEGEFYGLVHQTGKKNEEMLFRMAAEAHKKQLKSQSIRKLETECSSLKLISDSQVILSKEEIAIIKSEEQGTSEKKSEVTEEKTENYPGKSSEEGESRGEQHSSQEVRREQSESNEPPSESSAPSLQEDESR